MARAHRWAVLAVLLVVACGAPALDAAGSTAGGSSASGSDSPAPTGLPPRVVDLPARVVDLPARVLDLPARVVDVRPKVEAGAVAVNSDVLFDFASATLSVSAGAVLGQVVQRVAAARGRTVTITGHTDSVGSDRANLDLSRQRAQAVRAFLAPRARGVRFAVAGRGESQPVAQNEIGEVDNPAGRRLNRRVTIQIG
jgi:outer membrane protein OmpA-like peptidoglycan-associated protein